MRSSSHTTPLVNEQLEPRLLLSGTTYLVDSLADVVAADGVVTLREAIEAANTNTAVTDDVAAGSAAEMDIITFDQAALQAEAGAGNPLTITLDGSQIEITDDLAIEGLGADVLTVDADGRSRVFSVSGTDIDLIGLTITGGISDYGGGLFSRSSNGVITLTDCTVSGNSVSDNGGGIYNSGALVLDRCTVSMNTAAGNYSGGGGICNFGTATLNRSVVSGNAAVGNSGQGGGIYNYRTMMSTNSTIVGNTTSRTLSTGGGIYNVGALALTNSTVAGNASPYKGGGIYNHWSADSLTLVNTIIVLNEANLGSEIEGVFEAESCLMGLAPGFVRSPNAGPDGLWGTADDDTGDLRLLDTSIAINAGDAALAVDAGGAALPTDLVGNARVVDGQVDIGAYEHQGNVSTLRETASAIVTTLSDTVDSTDGEVCLREACWYGSALGEEVTFAAGLSGGTVDLSNGELGLYQPVSINATSIGGMTVDAAGQSRVVFISGPDTEVTLTGLTLTGGNASVGGGVYNYGSVLMLVNARVSGNTAAGYSSSMGGGIYSSGTLMVINSTVSGNTAYSGGGGIIASGTSTLTNSTVAGNAARYGGGIYNASTDTMTLANTIVALNEAEDNSDIQGSIVNHNGLVGWDPGFVRSPSVGVDGVWGTADDDLGDLRLTDKSHAINGGDATLALGPGGVPLATDLGGNARIVDGQVDIGAYEHQAPSPRETPSTHVTVLTDVTDATDDEITLREACWYGGGLATEVTFSAGLSGGTVTLNGTELVLQKSVSINAASIGGMTVDAGGQSRVIFVSGADTEVTLTGLTLTGGSASDGGGIYNHLGVLTLMNSTVSGSAATWSGGGVYSSGTLRLFDSTVSGNTAGYRGGGIDNSGTLTLSSSTVSVNTATGAGLCYGGGIYSSGPLEIVGSTVSENLVTSTHSSSGGGGIYCLEGTMALTDSTVSGNSVSYGAGGGLFCKEGVWTLTGSTVSGNTAQNGGGICNWGTMELVGSTVSGNTAAGNGDGGGIYSLGPLTVSGTLITANSAGSDGGGIYHTQRMMVITDSMVSGNTASYDGGGMYNGDTATLMNTAVYANSAGRDGGGLFNGYVDSLTLTNTTVSGNSAGRGGGVRNDRGTLTLTNSTVAGNSAQTVGGIYTFHYAGMGVSVLDNTVVAQNTDSASDDDDDVYGAYIGSNQFVGTRDGDPGLQAVLDVWGKPVYYRPRGGSPLVDAGDNALAVDADGAALLVDALGGPRIFGVVVDIGAVEVNDRLAILVEPMLEVYDGQSAPCWVRLSAAPAGTVSVSTSLLPGGSGDLTLETASIDFDAFNWDQPQRVGVRAAEIVNPTGPSDFGEAILSLTASGVDTAYVHVKIVESPVYYVVDSLGDTVAADGRVTLREALQAANTNAAVGDAPAGSPSNTDVIDFDYDALQAEAGPGADLVITLSGQELVINGDVDILGYKWKGILTVDANEASRVLRIEGADTEVTISGLDFTGGRAGSGAGIDCFEASLTLDNCDIYGNIAAGGLAGAAGGGIAISNGSLVMEYCSVRSNITSSSDIYAGGGGLYIGFSEVVIDTCFFTTNWAAGVFDGPLRGKGLGGAICFYGGSLTVTDADFAYNIAEHSGGAIYQFVGDAVIANSGFYGNSARDDDRDLFVTGYGGALATDTAGGTLRMVGCTVADNVAASGGGGLWIANGTGLVNCTVAGNTVTNGIGGGLGVGFNGALSVRSSTVVFNAAQAGGGIWSDPDSGGTGYGQFDMGNSIVAMNTAATGPDAFGTYSESSCFVGARDGDPLLAAVNDSLDRLLYYVPADTSPVVNAGDNDLLTPDLYDADGDGDIEERLPIDQAGFERVFGGTVDIGAVETSMAGVVGRHIFYNGSALDGNDPAATPADDGAVDLTKSALLPGQTPMATNSTGYSRGLTGIMIDIVGLTGTPAIEDFIFRTGTSGDVLSWPTAPAPASITVRPGEGELGSDRVTIIWADGAIDSEWLQVIVKSNPVTGLHASDTFYFASLPADITGNGTVDLDDFVVLKSNFGAFGGGIGAGDLNMSGNTDLDDFVVLKKAFGTSLASITAPQYLPCPGDADNDGDVDLDDFVILKQHFGQTSGATWGDGDFTGEGRVDLDDFVLLKKNFATAATVSAPIAAADDIVAETSTNPASWDRPPRRRARAAPSLRPSPPRRWSRRFDLPSEVDILSVLP